KVVHSNGHFADLVVAEILLLFLHEFTTTQLDHNILKEVNRNGYRSHQQDCTHDTPANKHCSQYPGDVTETSDRSDQCNIGFGCNLILHRCDLRQNLDNVI